MSGKLAHEIRAETIMEHEGTVLVGRQRLVRSGPSVGGLIPKEHAKMLGALDAGETDVYVNHELGAVVHLIPEEHR